MDRETMADMADLYCRSASAGIRAGEWKAACDALLERCRTLDMALQSLTPGGSEYVGNPDLCVAHAKDTLQRYREMWRDAARKKPRAE